MEELFIFADTFRDFSPLSLAYGEAEHHAGGSMGHKFLMMEIKQMERKELGPGTTPEGTPLEILKQGLTF